MSDDTFILASDVAKLIGYTDGAGFLRDRDRLERDLSFPAPMPTCRRPLKWRSSAIRAWRDAQLVRSKAINAAANRATQAAMMAEAGRV
ncbi:MAG: hypothetical protein AAF582_00035 [Pseudomonadota bacterium]